MTQTIRKVVIAVRGGVADVAECPDDVEVQIIDYDLQEDDGDDEHDRTYVETGAQAHAECQTRMDGYLAAGGEASHLRCPCIVHDTDGRTYVTGGYKENP